MSITNQIALYVAAHPGLTHRELCDAFSFPPNSGHVTYARVTGRIHAAGPRGWTRYYPTAESAEAADRRVRDEADAHKRARMAEASAERNRRRKAARALLGRSRNTRPNDAVEGRPKKRQFTADGVKVTLAAPVQEARTPATQAADQLAPRSWVTAYLSSRGAA